MYNNINGLYISHSMAEVRCERSRRQSEDGPVRRKPMSSVVSSPPMFPSCS